MLGLLNRVFRVKPGEWRKLLAFGLFGLMLQTGIGIGFSAGDAAFLTRVGPAKLPVIFLLTPLVMLVYTGVFSYLMVRFSLDRVVDVTLGLLVAGGLALWALLGPVAGGLPGGAAYYALKLYIAMWYIGVYTLFWNFTDAYFDIQDAKRLFPLFSAFCAAGTALGALIVGALADRLTARDFMLIWAGVALATVPVAIALRRRWRRIADTDADLDAEGRGVAAQLKLVAAAFRASRYVVMLTLTLFVTLLLTNLAEYQYSTVLQAGRTEAELAGLFGRLYAAASLFNLVVCLFVFNRLVTRLGVRNVALIQPLTYFAVFGALFLVGGTLPALAAFFAYHGVLTSIEYNNQNLLFNAAPSAVKRPLRTIVEGLCEPAAGFLAGGFLLLAARHVDMRELSGIGILLGALLIAVVMLLRNDYPAAMGANMRRGWLNFGDPGVRAPQFDAGAIAALEARAAGADSGTAATARALLHAGAPVRRDREAIAAEESEAVEAFAARLSSPSATARKAALLALASVVGPADIGLVPQLVEMLPGADRESRETILHLLGAIGDVETIPQMLTAAARLSPRELRATEAMLVRLGEAAIPRLARALGDYAMPYRARSVAARALAALSQAQFDSQLERLVADELAAAEPLQALAERLEAERDRARAVGLLAHAYRARIAASVDFTLELLALGGALPDFDLLIVSLHSANPKVRANAIEAIASGVDHATYRRLDPLIRGGSTGRAGDGRDLVDVLQDALGGGGAFEALAAGQALRDLLPPGELAGRLRRSLRPGLAASYRRSHARLLGLELGPTLVDLVEALRSMPEFAAASIESLAALAERATPEAAGRRPREVPLAGGGSYWLSGSDIDEVASRYADLSLTMLRAQDGRTYAA